MTPDQFQIRNIRKDDNPIIASTIREILVEFGLPKVGTVYEDIVLDTLFEFYNQERAHYFIIELEGQIVGGAGICQLENHDGAICELQKMYFKPIARGKGLGGKMIELCLEKAKAFGFEYCYLETMPYMKAARKLYRKVGFNDLDGPMGDTGHYACSRWMIKKLK